MSTLTFQMLGAGHPMNGFLKSGKPKLRPATDHWKSSHVLSGATMRRQKLQRSTSSTGVGRGGDDNQNFAAGLDGMSCLVNGKSILCVKAKANQSSG